MGRKFFVVGNWKCNVMNVDLKSIASYISLGNVTTPNPVGEVWSGPYMTYWWPEADVVISPPSVFLQYVKRWMRPDFHLAAQNCCGGGGAFTGEISAETLNDVGVPWVILGHTERRAFCGESNEFVGDKVAYALSHGLKVIACVGETLEQREAGSTMEVVTAQTKAIAEKVKDWTNIVLAYGPVWAIGTGKVASPAQAQEVHCELRKWLHANTSPEIAATTRIIYGGSVNGANCKELAGQPDVDGFLVGGASLQTDFIDIVNGAAAAAEADGAAAAAEADGAAVSAWASDEFRAGFATGTMFVVLICFGPMFFNKVVDNWFVN